MMREFPLSEDVIKTGIKRIYADTNKCITYIENGRAKPFMANYGDLKTTINGIRQTLDNINVNPEDIDKVVTDISSAWYEQSFSENNTAQDGSKVVPIEQTTPDGRKVWAYPAYYLILLWISGMKIIPTFKNSLHFNYEGLCTEEELSQCSGPIKNPMRLIYINPDFWTIERITKESWRFEGVRCLPGKTFIRDKDGNKIGNPRRLCILDIDNEGAYRKFKNLLENEWILSTYVTKTYDEFGYHVYWLEEWKDDDDLVTVDYRDCRNVDSIKFEIMIGLDCCQIAGKHREHLDSSFTYHNVGCKTVGRIEIAYIPGQYDKLLEMSKDILFFDDIKKRRNSQQKSKDPFHTKSYQNGSKTADTTINTSLLGSIALAPYVTDFISIWGETYYQPGKHYYFMIPFIGTLVRQYISDESVGTIIDKICSDKGDLGPNKKKWYDLLRKAYVRLSVEAPVAGIPALIETLHKHFNLDMAEADKQVQYLIEMIKATSEQPNSNQTSASSTSQSNTTISREEYEEQLTKEELTNEDIEFVLSTMIKEAECDEESIRQLFHACCSAFTRTPIAHNVNSVKAGAGKNHLINTVAKYFPEEYVCFYNHMSDKALFHQPGKFVIPKFNIETGEEELIDAEPILNKIDEKIKLLEATKNDVGNNSRESIRELEKEKEDIKNQVEKLINLDNTINIFVDTPPESLLNAMMSLLSQDVKDQRYYFTDKSSVSGLGSKCNRLRGAPCVIQARVSENTKDERFGERNRRYVNVNPETSADKIKAANRINISRYVSTLEEYDNEVVSREDMKKAKRIVRILVAKLKYHSKNLEVKKTGTYLPEILRKAIHSAIPYQDGQVWSMTIIERLMGYLTIIAKERMDDRVKFVYRDYSTIIATTEDLRDALDLMGKVGSRVRPYLLGWFNDCFIPTYNDNPRLNKETRKGGKSGDYVVEEKRRGLSTNQLIDVMQNKGEYISVDDLRHRYLYTLINQGYIGSQDSVLDGRQHIYFPTGNHEMTIFSEGLKLKVDSSVYPTPERIRESFLKIRRYGDTELQNSPKIIFKNKEIEMADLVKMYLRISVSCFEVIGQEEKEATPFKQSSPKKPWYIDDKIKNVQIKPFFKETLYARAIGITLNLGGKDEEKGIRHLIDYGPIEYRSKVIDGGPNPLDFCQSLSKKRVEKVDPLHQLNSHQQQQVTIQLIQSESVLEKLSRLLQLLSKPQLAFTPEQPPLEPVSIKSTVEPPALPEENTTSINQQYQQLPSSLLDKVPELGKLAFFDCEWHMDNSIGIGNVYIFCLVDNQGQNIKLHIQNFGGNGHDFMSTVLDVMEQYTTLAGYSIFTNKRRNFYSDLYHLENSCDNAGLSERFAHLKLQMNFIDANEIFSNNVIKGFLKATGISYRGGLEETTQAYLGKGKIEGISGINLDSISKDTTLSHEEIINRQLEYCFRDAQLCSELLRKNNYELLHILYEISQEVKLPFFETVNTQYPTRWWRSKLTSISCEKISSDVQDWIDDNTVIDSDGKKSVKYLGAYVAEPKTGRYLSAASYDISSMYPTMIVAHNISTNTINCNCCKDDPSANIPDQVMKSINDYVIYPKNKAQKQEPRPWHYRICQKKKGQLSEVMSNLMSLKRQYKKSGQKLKEKAIKILMNSGYGCFGNLYFEFRDPRVAELITAFGQYAIKELEKFAGDKMIYGDTDSIYLTSQDENIIAKANELDVILEFERLWKGLFLTPNKKQYFGITADDKEVRKTLKGIKSDQPSYFNGVTTKLISKEFMELVIREVNSNPLEKIVSYIKSAFSQLTEKYDIDKLAFSQEAKKALYEYKNNGRERQIFNEILEDCGGDIESAKTKAQAKEVYHYWKIIDKSKGKSATIHPEKYQLNIVRYKIELFNCIEPILHAYGMKLEEIRQLQTEVGAFITRISKLNKKKIKVEDKQQTRKVEIK